MPKKKLLDSARDYLERVHATHTKNVPNILASELRPMPHRLDPRGSKPTVFMSVGNRLDNTFYDASGTAERAGLRDALIKYRIPKDWHRRNVVLNPHYADKWIEKDPDWPYSYEANSAERGVVDVMHGGRSTTYEAPVPNEFIDEICFGPDASMCYDPVELKSHIMNESPDMADDLWEWDYEFYPTYEDMYKKYGRRK